jgi:hypothetical protein
MELSNEKAMLESTNVVKIKQAKKRMMNHYSHDQKLYFKDLCVPNRKKKAFGSSNA